MENLINTQSNNNATRGELAPPLPIEAHVQDPSDLYSPELVRKIVALGSVAIENSEAESRDTALHREQISDINPSRKDKKKVWTTDIKGAIEKPIDPITGKGMETPQQFAVNGIRDEVAAMRIAKKVKHHATQNAEKSLLESGIFEINSETGKSKLRNSGLTINGKDASLNHLSRGMRKRVKKAEKRHKKLSQHNSH